MLSPVPTHASATGYFEYEHDLPRQHLGVADHGVTHLDMTVNNAVASGLVFYTLHKLLWGERRRDSQK